MNPDPDLAFYVNLDLVSVLDTDPGFYEQNLEKIQMEKNISFFIKNLLIPRPP